MNELPSDCYFYVALHGSTATMKMQTDIMVSLFHCWIATVNK